MAIEMTELEWLWQKGKIGRAYLFMWIGAGHGTAEEVVTQLFRNGGQKPDSVVRTGNNVVAKLGDKTYEYTVTQSVPTD